MALTTLVPVASYDDVRVPNNGTKVVAVSATDPPPNDEGPVRPAFQALANRIKWLRDKILAGVRSFKALKIDGTGDLLVAPADGSLYVSGASSLVGDVEIGGGLTVISTGVTTRKFIMTTDSGGLAVPYGVLVQDLSPFGVASAASDGTLLHHANIAPHPSTPKPSTGRYTLILQTCPPSCTGLSDGDPAPITLLVSVNDPAETGRGDTFLYRGNAWAKKQTLSGLPKVVIDVTTVAQGISAGALTKSLADMPFSIAVWA